MQKENKKYTNSIQCGKDLLQNHNMQKYPEKHIDPNGPHETIIHEKPQKVICEKLKDVAEKYNEKQKRADRKIDLKKYAKEQEKMMKEAIVMVGKYGNKPDKKVVYEILKEYLDGWNERNPNLILMGAYYHGNEKAGDHLHLDFLGMGHGYSKGLSTRVSLNRALEEMGFTAGPDEEGKYKYPIVKWLDRERKVLDNTCKAHGLKIHHPEIEFREHMKIQKFRDVMELKNLHQEIQRAKELIDKLRGNIEELKLTASIGNDNLEEIQERVEERMQDVTYEVTLSRKEYNELLKSAMAYESVLDMYTDRGERMIEMHETLSEYKHSLEKMEKNVEKLEEFEEILANTPAEDGMSALEAYEKKKKAEKKKAEQELAKKK